ncbi:MAG: hypothetical protein HKN00_04560 [Flavobacteriaceae bacterium]|nr:hypothetical protein [Bacteroidia bacterium]MBT8287951.1 hypothetical protein [Bacteroidia bacterium]NNF74434.1 hypothetical protein [Flavobacteriaceae bacterium]NNK73647.1 hypothetical protein [Flavobacteriaceae bacterium]RZW39079.1 MAG: hypothetical protein EX263_13780 [Flavobacteriaceae bacterium]
MDRKIVDYQKLTDEILQLLVEKYPDGYDESDIITFRNIRNEVVEAVEIRTDDTMYLVKIGTRLVQAMEDFMDDDDDQDDDDLDFKDIPDDTIDEN